MNKILLSAFSLAISATAVCSAQTGVLIPRGNYVPDVYRTVNPMEYEEIDLEAYPAGISSFSIRGTWKINREAKGFITFKVNDVVANQIPANNTQLFYCIDEFNRGEWGSPFIAFTTESQQNTPYKYTGYYEINIPAGFLIDREGNFNREVVARYEISNSRFIATPSTGSNVESLSELVLEFPDATSLQKTGSCTLEYLLDGTTGDDATVPEAITITPVIEGNKATFTFNPPYTEKGRVLIDLNAGAFTTTYSKGPKSSKTAFTGLSINVTGKQADTSGGWSVTPAPGTYDGIASHAVAGTASGDLEDMQAYFILTPPEGKTINFVMMSAAKLVNVNDPSIVYPASSGFGKKKAPDGSLFLYDSRSERTAGKLMPEPGDYELVINPGLIYYKEGGSSPEMRFRYTFTASEIPVKYEITPSSTETITAPISEVRIKFPEAKSIQWQPGGYVPIKCGTYEYVANATIDADDPTLLVLTIPGGLNLDGTYDFNVSSTYLKVDGISTPVFFSYKMVLPDPYDGMKFFPPYDYKSIENKIDLEAYPQGLSSISVQFNETLYPKGVEINRDAEGFITLYCDGSVLKQIPASNVKNLYTYINAGEGAGKAPTGQLQVDFYDDPSSSPAQYTGNYEVVIPAGFFHYADTDIENPEIELSYQITGNARFTALPAQGASVESLSEITLEFPEAIFVERGAGQIEAELIGSDETENVYIVKDADITINGNKAVIKFPTPYESKGRLLVTYSAGAFKTGYANGASSSTGNQINSYSITPGAASSSEGYDIFPAAGKYAEIKSWAVAGTEDSSGKPYYAYFRVTPPAGSTVSFAGMSPVKMYPVVDGVVDKSKATLQFKLVAAVNPESTDGAKAYYLCSSDYNLWREESILPIAPGDYQLICAPNTFYNTDAEGNRAANAVEITWNFTIEGSALPEYNVTPDPAEIQNNPLSVITVTFPGAKEGILTRGANAIINSGAVEYIAELSMNKNENGVQLVMTIPAPIRVPGEYTVNVPANAFKVDGIPAPLTINYTLSPTVGVDEIGADAENAPIFNLLGVKVGEGVQNLKKLAPAVYIINGKKVIVK